MYTIIALLFVLGYICIASENVIKINKTATAILTGVLCWTLYIISNVSPADSVNGKLLEHLGDVASIIFFLMSAMTIVELIDAHNGFEAITKLINTTNKRKLLWITAILAFFLSSILDNLTTTIVFITLLRKLVPEKKDRLIFASMIVIAANAGGAWTPIGDVTTTMLWIANRLTTSNIMVRLFLPSIVSLIIPLVLVSFTIKGNVTYSKDKAPSKASVSGFEQRLILFLGLGALLFVPVFKEITNLPPFMGILFGLGILWLVTEILHRKKDEDHKHLFSVNSALKRMDMPSVLFFLGILLAIAALQTAGHLTQLSVVLDQKLHNLNLIAVSMGLLSAIIDNVPMVAATIGMYPLSQFPIDHSLWEMLAYCVGTGGSVLIIGSAAGVAAMGLEKIDFVWYMKKISLPALIGYFAGVGIYLLEEMFLRF